MDTHISDIYKKIQALEAQLEAEMAIKRANLKYRIEKNKIIFEEDILKRQAELKTTLAKYIFQTNPLVILTTPFIYVLIFPLLLLDAFITLYQAICFPVYRIEKVKRADYIIFDRAFLPYLNLIEKINCAYCSYANGILSYAREIASRTEQYWCPIKHAKKATQAHSRYFNFVDYGDADKFRQEQEKLREDLQEKNNKEDK